MNSPPPPAGGRRAAALLVAVLAAAPYVLSLPGGFVSDDWRFITDNEAVHELSLSRLAGYFTDPRSQGTEGRDVYRPLRTIEFAAEWALFGNRPFWFRTSSLLHHVVASLVVFALLRRLLPGGGPGPGGPATLGAILFAIHPVNAESVAFVSSRGDLLCLILVGGALILHLDGRRLAAALLLVPALFAKEIAAVFAAFAFLADRLLERRIDRPAAVAYAAYLGIAGGFFLLWRSLVSADPGHAEAWLGGSWAMSVVTALKGFFYDVKVLVFPVDLVFGWHVPSRRTIGAPEIVFGGAALAVLATALVAGRRSRFAALWFLAGILPVAGILWPMTIPTAERFLLLPSVGFAAWAGPLLARTRLAPVVLGCFLLLCTDRALDWRTTETLWDSVIERADTPTGLKVRAARAYERMMDPAAEPADRTEAAEEVVRTAAAFVRLYREEIHLDAEPAPGRVVMPVALGAEVLARSAMALAGLGRYDEAIPAAQAAIALGGEPWWTAAAWDALSISHAESGRPGEAEEAARRAAAIRAAAGE